MPSDWQRVPWGTAILYRVGPIRQIGIVVDDLKRTSTGIRGWVELHLLDDSESFPAGVPVHFASYDLTGSRTVAGIIAGWKQAHVQGINLEEWWVSHALYDAIETVKAGPGDPVALGRVTVSDVQARNRWLIEPLWGRVGATRLIAEGGSGKSFLALALALQVTVDTNKVLHGRRPTVSGPVLYLDWEADADTHAQRLTALADGAGIADADFADQVLYMDMRAHGPLHRTAPAIRRQVSKVGAVAVVVDSVMLARGSSGEGPAEESAVRLFEAIDQIGVPALLIDHKSKEQAKSKTRRGGYGSVVMDNQSRNVWDVTKTFPLASGRRLELTHTKANNTRLYDPVALELRFEQDKVTFTNTSPLSGWGQAIETTEDRVIRAIIEYGPMTATDLQSALNVSPDAIRKAVSKSDLIVPVARGDHNRKLYGLADDAPIPLPPAQVVGIGDNADLPTPF